MVTVLVLFSEAGLMKEAKSAFGGRSGSEISMQK